MNKYVFWSALHKNISVAFNEPLTHYAGGDTFWRAMANLFEILKNCSPSLLAEESDLQARLKMYHETGIHKVEIFVGKEGDRYGIRCANSRSLLDASNEFEALKKFVAVRAKTSLVNTGEPEKP